MVAHVMAHAPSRNCRSKICGAIVVLPCGHNFTPNCLAKAFIQAALLTLYDPDRSKMVTHNGRVDTWEHVQSLLLDVREEKRINQGIGLRILTQTVTSPTMADQLKRLEEQFPKAKWHSYEPISRNAVRAFNLVNRLVGGY